MAWWRLLRRLAWRLAPLSYFWTANECFYKSKRLAGCCKGG
jgi:hypothetical protein